MTSFIQHSAGAPAEILAADKTELERQCRIVAEQRAAEENAKIAELERKLAQQAKLSDVPFNQQS